MSMLLQGWGIMCDRCGIGDSILGHCDNELRSQAKKEFKEMGWVFIDSGGWSDTLCPDCAKNKECHVVEDPSIALHDSLGVLLGVEEGKEVFDRLWKRTKERLP